MATRVRGKWFSASEGKEARAHAKEKKLKLFKVKMGIGPQYYVASALPKGLVNEEKKGKVTIAEMATPWIK